MKGWTQADVDRIGEKRKVKIPAVSTNALTKHALEILTLKGFHCWRQNNGGIYDAKIKGYRSNSSTPGISDIIGFHKKTGQFIACEIKAGKEPSEENKTLKEPLKPFKRVEGNYSNPQWSKLLNEAI